MFQVSLQLLHVIWSASEDTITLSKRAQCCTSPPPPPPPSIAYRDNASVCTGQARIDGLAVTCEAEAKPGLRRGRKWSRYAASWRRAASSCSDDRTALCTPLTASTRLCASSTITTDPVSSRPRDSLVSYHRFWITLCKSVRT